MARRAVAVLLVGMALAVQTWFFAGYGSFNLDRIGSEDPAYHSDFETFWRSADALLHGADITAAAGTLLGVAVCGLDASLTWVQLVLAHPVQTFFGNASLPATLVRLTSDSGWGRPLVEVPGGLLVGTVLGVATLWATRRPGVDGMWAVAAASLVASPVTWNTYLVVLAPPSSWCWRGPGRPPRHCSRSRCSARSGPRSGTATTAPRPRCRSRCTARC